MLFKMYDCQQQKNYRACKEKRKYGTYTGQKEIHRNHSWENLDDKFTRQKF